MHVYVITSCQHLNLISVDIQRHSTLEYAFDVIILHESFTQSFVTEQIHEVNKQCICSFLIKWLLVLLYIQSTAGFALVFLRIIIY